MCGIFSIISSSKVNNKLLKETIKNGLDLINHRGPDGRGEWISNNSKIGFGHVRLSILDLNTGSQPMSLADETTIIFNGEIYNFIELRKELGLDKFKTTSDTEVILHAYKKWGTACVSHFNGMFAFILWDPVKKLIFFGRDRFGIKPLYYYQAPNDTYYFASEIKALIPFINNIGINHKSLSDYFSFQHITGNATLFNDINEIPPSYFGTIDHHNKISLHRYWDIHYEIDYEMSAKSFEEELHELIEQSVKMHMRADVEVGSYVSGGIDSSLIAVYGSEVRSNQDVAFKIFNGKFEEGNDYDESIYAQALAKYKSFDLKIANISENDFVNNIQKIIFHLDTPVAGPGSFPQYMVSSLASNYLKVVLGGQGGDEIFGGYTRYLIAYFEQCILGAIDGTLNNPKFIVTYESIINNLTSLQSYKPLIKEFWSDGLFDERDLRYLRLINRANTILPLLNNDVIDQSLVLENFQRIFWRNNTNKESYFDQMTHYDFKTLLPALLQVEDRMSMAHGLESRIPFLDHNLIERVATVPANIKFQDGELKKLLKNIAIKKLPKLIYSRKDKKGFPVPLNLWIKRGGITKEFIMDIFSSSKARNRFYLKNKISVDDILDTKSMFSRNLWGLLNLELWQQEFIDT